MIKIFLKNFFPFFQDILSDCFMKKDILEENGLMNPSKVGSGVGEIFLCKK